MKLATLCYVRREGCTLMVHRNKRPQDMHLGKWNGLGGKLEPGETPEQCARREILEESGLVVDRLVWKGILTFPGFANDEDWYTFIYLANVFPGELVDSPEGELSWIPDSEVLELNLWAGDRIFIPWLERPEFFSGMFRYVDGEFIDYTVNFYQAGERLP